MPSKEAMVQFALDVAADDSHGYSQAYRWPWQGDDFDCSSLMYTAAHEAGYDVPLSGYTGTMSADFTNAGFTWHAYGSVALERGDILVAHNDAWQHTEMYIGDGMNVGAHSSETGGIYGQMGDQTGYEISVAPNPGGWDFVLRPPEDEGDDDMAWDYKNPSMNGDKDAYQLLTDIHRACGGGAADNLAALTYKNKKMNGDADVYQMLTDMRRALVDIDKRLAKIERK